VFHHVDFIDPNRIDGVGIDEKGGDVGIVLEQGFNFFYISPGFQFIFLMYLVYFLLKSIF